MNFVRERDEVSDFKTTGQILRQEFVKLCCELRQRPIEKAA